MIKITSLDHNGRGIGKIDGKIVFVPFTLPGDVVDIRIINEKKNYIEAEVCNYIEESNDRIKSPCIYFGTCGGCDIMHMNYDSQILFKQQKVENIVNKYLEGNVKINRIVKSDNVLNYRNKVTFQVKENIGFYKNKSYELIPIDKCLLCCDRINGAIKYLNLLDLSIIDKITCRCASNKLMIIISTKKHINNLFIEKIKDIADSIYMEYNGRYELLYGNEYLTEHLGKYSYLISPDSFFQVNIDICLKLYTKISEYVNTGKNVLDLYCGTGSIGIFVSEGNNVLGVEINESAIRDALKNKEINKLENISFVCGDSGKCTDNIDFKPDIIIVDPPRNGLNKLTIENILKLMPNEILYVSCDPMTLVRDLNYLGKNYDIKEITPFDMFPNTKHVENLAYLLKK